LRLYDDGVEADTATLTDDMKTGSRDLIIGKASWDTTYYFVGTIKEVRVSNSVRSSAWIKATSESLADELLSFGEEESWCKFPNDWQHRQKITIDHTKIDSDLSDFPIKVILNNTNFDFSKAQADGADIRFTSEDGETLLKHEREVHNDTLYHDGIDDLTTFTEGLSTFGLDDIATVEFDIKAEKDFSGAHGFWSIEIDRDNRLVFASFTNGFVGVWHEYSDTGTGGNVASYLTDYSSTHSIRIEIDNTAKTFDIYVDGTKRVDATSFSHVLSTNSPTKIEFGRYVNDTPHSCYGKCDISNFVIKDSVGDILWSTRSAVYHVKVPSVSSSSNTDIYMYYGNSGASDGADAENVWDSDYELVMHMDDSLEDSTSNGNAGSNGGSTLGLGSDGYYRSFDGSNDYISLPSGLEAIMQGDADFTLESYLKQKSTTHAQWIFSFRRTTNVHLYDTGTDYSPNHNLVFCVNDDPDCADTAPTYETPFHVASVFETASNSDLFINGVKEDTKVHSISSISAKNDGDQFIGKPSWKYSDYLDGSVYETRISSIARSSAWIKATSESLADGLLSFGSEEELTITATLSNTPVSKISDETGKDSCEVKFQCDKDFDEWEARATTSAQTPGQGVGLLVGSGDAGYSADTDVTFYVDDEELTSGDVLYTITIFVKKDGSWYE